MGITAIHFKLLHPTATLFWGIWVWGFLLLNRKIFGSLWVAFSSLILFPLDTSKGKLLRKLFYWFLLFPT